jgi:hypothetical protein
MLNSQYCRCVLSVGGNQFLKMADVILDKNENKIIMINLQVIGTVK